MTARNPLDRYQTPVEVVQALAPFVKQTAMPKASPKLSSGATVGKPAVKVAAIADPPLTSATEAPKRQPGPTKVWESLTESSAASVGLPNSQVIRTPQAATGRGRTTRIKWLVGCGAAVGVLLLALLGMWSGGERQPIRVSSQPDSAIASEPPDVPIHEEENDGLIDPNPSLFIRFHDKGDKELPWPTMRFGLLAKVPKHPDQPKKLSFDEHGRVNNTVILVDGRQYLFGQPNPPRLGLDETDPPGEWLVMNAKLKGEIAGRPRDGLASSWLLPGRKLKITQEAEIVPGQQSRRLDTCLVRYILKNQDSLPHQIGIRFMLDTFIGGNDGVPFAVPAVSVLCDTKLMFDRQDEVPDFLQAVENADLRDPGTVALLQFHVGKNIESPSRVQLGGWPDSKLRKIGIQAVNSQFTGWSVPFISMKERIDNYITNDSAVIMYWNEQTFEPGKTRVVGFTYGLGNADTHESGGHLLLTAGGQLVPNVDFTLLALAHNPIPDEALTLELPTGIETAEQQMTQKVPAVPPGASRQDSPVTWRLRASKAGKYELSVRSSAGGVHSRNVVRMSGRG
jgi:hypothetical protein